MTRVLGALRTAFVPTAGTPATSDPVAAFIAMRLRERRPRGAAAWARFMDETRRAIRKGNVPSVVPAESLDAFQMEGSPRGTACIPPLLACP